MQVDDFAPALTMHSTDEGNDSDSDDEWVNISFFPYKNKHTTSMTPNKKKNTPSMTPNKNVRQKPSTETLCGAQFSTRFVIHDDITFINPHGVSSHMNGHIVDIVHNEQYGTMYYVIPENARPFDARVILNEKQMSDPHYVQHWAHCNSPSVLHTHLIQCAALVGTYIHSTSHGYGLFASVDLPKGHQIPYWGKLSAFQRDQGEYNCQINNYVYLVADDPKDRGPGAFCNDCTVQVKDGCDVMCTSLRENATLQWTTPHNHYLHDWAHYKNDGSEFNMFVELLCNVRANEEICVCYGKDQYWRDVSVGSRMSNPHIV